MIVGCRLLRCPVLLVGREWVVSTVEERGDPPDFSSGESRRCVGVLFCVSDPQDL